MPLRVSVVIPSYKSSPYLEATLESVVRQTHPSECLEVLVIDDASPDNSVDVARRFLARHSLSSKVVARETNSGAAAARNAGWKLASGDWIQFLDQDDLLAPNKIELQAELASRADEDVSVVYSNWQHYLLEEGRWRPSGPLNSPYVDDDPLIQILQQQTFGYVGPTLIRKSSIAAIGGFDEKPNLGEDCDLMLRLAMAGCKFREAHSDEAVFFYRQSPNSLWRNYIRNVEAMRNLLHGFRNVEEFLREQSPDRRLSAQARAAIAKRYSRFVDVYFEHDRESFRLLIGWLKDLGFDRPTDINPRLKMISSVIGYEKAMRLRSVFRSLFQPQLSA